MWLVELVKALEPVVAKVKAPPGAIITFLAIGGTGGWIVSSTIHEGEIKGLRAEIVVDDKRLQAKEEETARYRAKAELLDKASSNPGKATDSELRVLTLVELCEFVEESNADRMARVRRVRRYLYPDPDSPFSARERE